MDVTVCKSASVIGVFSVCVWPSFILSPMDECILYSGPYSAYTFQNERDVLILRVSTFQGKDFH